MLPAGSPPEPEPDVEVPNPPPLWTAVLLGAGLYLLTHRRR